MNAVAIIIAGALIAAAIALTNHWALYQNSDTLLRLNRWTGDVIVCGHSESDASKLSDEELTKVPCPLVIPPRPKAP